MSSIMQFHGTNQQIIDGFIGHKVPYNNAYSRLGDEELREIYSNVEKYLTLDYREDFVKVEGRVKNLEVMNKGYEVKIDELKGEIRELKDVQKIQAQGLREADDKKISVSDVLKLFEIVGEDKDLKKKLHDMLKENGY